jgi:SAM-dependent methyltransferase
LANLAEMQSPAFTELMLEINSFAHSHGLREFSTWSKIWEYPWIWIHGISSVSLKGRTVVDLGSEISPMPWIIALRGAKVHLVETDPQWRPVWEKLRFKLGVDVEWHIVDSEKLPLPDASCDLVTSFSVIEHQRDKFRAVAEVVRVLKPDGKFALSYDICETEMGMSFPEWNGRALALAEFTKLVWLHPAWAIDAVPEWNTGNILPFLEWHRTTAPHHNYIVGAACLTKKNAAKPGPSPIVFGGGWHAHEAAGKDWWRWASSSASVFVRLTPGTEAILSGEILSRAKTDRVHVTLDGREIAVYDTNASEFVPFTLPHFAVTCLIHHLIFQCDSQALIEGVDPRPLGFAIRNFSVYPAPEYIRL